MSLISSIVGANAARRIESLLTYAALIAAFAMVIGIVLAKAEVKPDAVHIGDLRGGVQERCV